MDEFDNWKEDQERIHNDYDAENAWNAGQQSQQSKIDLLEKELTETQAFLNKQNHIKQTKIDCMKVELDGVNERAMMMFNHKNAMVDKMQAKIDELQARIDVYDEHVKALKNIHENDFNEESKSSYILGNLDGFFECIESDLEVVRDD